jgi:periplasmic divalent cation tolerance protein
MTTAALVLTTFPDEAGAHAFARSAVEKQLAACINILPSMQSIYRWDGKVQEAREHQLIIKTSDAQIAALTNLLKQSHPYELPELIVLDIAEGTPAYLQWLVDATS